MRSHPGQGRVAVDEAFRQWAITGTPRSWAVSHTAFISSRVHTCSSPAWVGIEPVAWILIQSAPSLIWRRVVSTISSRVATTAA